jgi:uncharacterized protein (TIGR04222 family)
MIDYVQQALLADHPSDLGIAAHVVDLAERGLLTVGRDETGAVVVTRRDPPGAVHLSAADIALLFELQSRDPRATTSWQLYRFRFESSGTRLEQRARDELRAAGLWEPRPAATAKTIVAAAVLAGLAGAGWVAFGWTDGDRLLIGAWAALTVLAFGWLAYDVIRKRMRLTSAGQRELAGAQRVADTDRLAPLLANLRWREWSGLQSDTPPDWLTGGPWPVGRDDTARAAMLKDVLRTIRVAFRQQAERGNP